MFRGVRFDVPAGAELIVHADGNIVFTGITDYVSSATTHVRGTRARSRGYRMCHIDPRCSILVGSPLMAYMDM